MASRCPYCTSEFASTNSQTISAIGSLLKLGVFLFLAVLLIGFLQWLWKAAIAIVNWIWDLITWPFRMAWNILVLAWDFLCNIFYLFIGVIDYPSIALSKVLGLNFSPTPMTTIFSLLLEISSVIFVFFIIGKNIDRANR
jgi:hypothetical protein